MIAIAVGAVLAVAVVAAVWSRLVSARLDRRSVEGYGRALDKLGGVARRSEAGAPVQAPTGPELARPHVRPSSDVEPHARPAAEPVSPAPRIRLRPSAPSGAMPVFSDLPSEAQHEHPGAAHLPPVPPVPPVTVGGADPAPVDEPTLAFPIDKDGASTSAGARNGTGPGDDDPLTMVLPAVPLADPPAPADPLMGPFLPGEEPPAAAAELPAAATELPAPAPPVAPALHPSALVFDAEGSGDDDAPAHGAGQERSQKMRRAATGAAAAVAIGALGAGGWQLAADSGGHAHAGNAPTRTPVGSAHVRPPGSSSGSGGAPAPSRTRPTHATGGGSPAGARTTTTSPATGTNGGALQPTSTSSSLVAYQAPSSHYTITFSVTGSSDCWLGAQASPHGAYLWMQTVPAGGTTTYTASGPVVIRLGAPPVVSVSVNGIKVALPPGNVQPYDISFTPSTRAA